MFRRQYSEFQRVFIDTYHELTNRTPPLGLESLEDLDETKLNYLLNTFNLDTTIQTDLTSSSAQKQQKFNQRKREEIEKINMIKDFIYSEGFDTNYANEFLMIQGYINKYRRNKWKKIKQNTLTTIVTRW